ncbi:glycine betaine ABC transporter substrate-binding protein [uncultured Nocardioides sp.]|uniref:ABC transporter substrate-binding protein n=1 Tax=uncultured Nocardioides sp. TaxID=198441 RepID=UPI002621ED72|nr:glycine betaine ABC transporter substrate-binding protein [uncultured Nocardioides sp.]
MRVVAVGAAGLLAAGLLTACGTSTEQDASQQPQGASVRVRIGTQEFPEARVLGELWRQALAVNGYAVDLQTGVGPAEDLDEALAAEEIDGYVAYTGTVLSVVAGEDVSGLDPEETYRAAEDFYATQDMVMSEMTPFENTDAVAVTPEYARAEGLSEIGDLADVGPLRFGGRPEFEDLDLGLVGLSDVYGLDDVDFVPLELGTQYAALDDGEVDAVDAFSTDPQLEGGGYTLLEDPERLFGSQNVAMVLGEPKLERIDGEAFLTVVDTVNRSLTEEAMVAMNAQVADGRDPGDVARAYLDDEGLTTPLDLG